MKMARLNAYGLILAFAIAANAQTINVRGKISNPGGQAVSGAIVELAVQKIKDTTAADGMYSLARSVIGTLPQAFPLTGRMALDGSVLELVLGQSMPVKVEVFDVQGNLLKIEALANASAGAYRWDLAEMGQSDNMRIIKASIGGQVQSLSYFPTSGSGNAVRRQAIVDAPKSARLAKVSATVDTLKISAPGLAPKTMLLSSYDTTVNVSLGTTGDRWGGLKNAPIKSAGCGKALGTINKSGTYHITSGSRGDYIIDIPTGYDKDTPYRLIFGMHCMGGTAARLAAADNGDDLSAYYSLKTHAAKDNIPAIFVAPQGNSDGTWNPSSDPKFFTDILALLEGSLCVDTTRVFVAGFSFGAMFSYSLSLSHPELIRAVATYAPANWNFNPQPTNRKIPIAYYQTTGTQDDLCKWINNDAQKTGGKYCLLQHAQDNGCNTSGEIKLATSGTHVVTEFAGCNEGYPVKFSSFNGGHTAVSSDPGSNVNWMETETWEFFKRF